MKYYRGITSGGIYRTENITFSSGEPSLRVQRWNWDFENWHGHIHDTALTRKRIEEGVEIIEITEEEALNFIGK